MYPERLYEQVITGPEEPVVTLRQGRYRGILSGNLFIFRGIPYAKAKRFRLPEEADSFEGIRNARSEGAMCPQIRTVIPDDAGEVPYYFYPQSEDCLNLTIWTPKIRDCRTEYTETSEGRPVLVWIHGRDMRGYAAKTWSEEGSELARFGDVVVVALQYRLHVLGFLDLSAYGEEYRHSGNLGTKDLAAALIWIHDNIAAFGGDPDNVTLFGRGSAGEMIRALMRDPSAKGRYHRAALYGGCRDTDRNRDLRDSGQESRGSQADADRKPARFILDELRIPPNQIRELDRMPFWQLAIGAQIGMDRFEKQYGLYTFRPPERDRLSTADCVLSADCGREARRQSDPVIMISEDVKTPFLFHNAAFSESVYVPGRTEEQEDRIAGGLVHFARFGSAGISSDSQ